MGAGFRTDPADERFMVEIQQSEDYSISTFICISGVFRTCLCGCNVSIYNNCDQNMNTQGNYIDIVIFLHSFTAVITGGEL